MGTADVGFVATDERINKLCLVWHAVEDMLGFVANSDGYGVVPARPWSASFFHSLEIVVDFFVPSSINRQM